MREELEKILHGKLLYCLILLSAVGNLFLMCIQSEKTGVLGILDKFTAEHGAVVSAESMDVLREMWDNSGSNPISWGEYQNDLGMASKYYSLVTTEAMADGYCHLMRLEGRAAEFVREGFQALDGQVKKAQKQVLTYFAPYQTHLFDSISTYLLFALNLEGILSAVILTLHSLDVERTSHTWTMIDSTRKGIRVIKDKLFASVLSSLMCFLIISGVSLLATICIFPARTVSTTLLTNPLVTLKGAPCVAQAAVTVGTYILFSVATSMVLVVVCSLMSFAIGLRTKNGYFAFGVLMVCFGIMKVISVTAPTSTMVFFWSQYNPIDMALKAGTWFLYNQNNFSPLGYEVWTLLLWLVVGVIGCVFGLYAWKRKKVEL